MKRRIFLITSLLALISFSACSSNNDGMDGGTEAKLTGVSGSLILLNNNKEEICPYEINDNETTFYVTTLKYYELGISPKFSGGSKSIAFDGDYIIFDDEVGRYEYNDTILHYTSYGEFYYLGSPGRPLYSAHFTRIGTYDLNFTYSNYKTKIRIVCDNESDKYDGYRADMSDIFPWAKNLSLDDVDKVRLQQCGIGVAPGSFDFVKYTTDRNDISNVYNLLLSKVMVSETNAHQISGGGFNTITFYSGDNSYDMKIYNGFTPGDDSLSSNFAYHIEKIPGTTRIDNPYQECYSFITYGTDDCYAYRSEEDTEGVLVNYLDKLEFVEWGDNPMDDNMPEFYIDDGLKLSSKLYIYAADRFKYEDVFYRVIGDVNFSNLFEQA